MSTDKELERLRPFYRHLAYVSYLTGSVALCFVIGLMMTDVISRRLLSRPLAFSYELSCLAFLVSAWSGVLNSTASDQHISIDFIYMRLSSPVRAVLSLAFSITSCTMLALGALALVAYVVDLYASGRSTEVMRLPLWPFALVAMTAAVLTAVSFLRRVRP
ncbi:MAG: TRAP transporter small permease [candidate division WOR-3 bacterium]